MPSSNPSDIRWLVLDVDGVMTDGKLYFTDNGHLSRRFSIYDGLALALAPRFGLHIGIISGRPDEGIRIRAGELGIREVHFNVHRKDIALRELAERHRVPLSMVAFMGDDLNDIPALRIAGYRMTVPNAVPEVIAIADWVSPVAGGEGAVRKAVEHLFELKGTRFADLVLEVLTQNST